MIPAFRPRAPVMLIAGALVFLSPCSMKGMKGMNGMNGTLGVALASPPTEAAGSNEPSADPEAEALDAEAEESEANDQVLIRVVPDDDQLRARLRAELGVVGLGTELLNVASDAPMLGPDLLDELAQGGAGAAIEIVVREERIELWVADARTGKVLSRRLDLAMDPAQADPRTVAIAAVELLRASRLESDPTRLPDQGSQDPVTPATPDPSDAPDLEDREDPAQPDRPLTGAISLGPLVGASPGGFGITTHIELAGRWVPTRWLALRVSAWIPTVGNGVDVSDGRVRMFVGMAFVEPQLRLPGGAPWFHPVLGVGLGGAVIGFEGTAREGLRSTTQVVGGFAGYGHGGFGFVVVPRVWIRLDAYVGTVQPVPQIRSAADQVEATWGTPFGMGSLGLEVWL